MIISLLLLIGSQVLFMEATVFWLMCLARVIQGVRQVGFTLHQVSPIADWLCSSATVWVVAFSLLWVPSVDVLRAVTHKGEKLRCDTVPEKRLGRLYPFTAPRISH